MSAVGVGVCLCTWGKMGLSVCLGKWLGLERRYGVVPICSNQNPLPSGFWKVALTVLLPSIHFTAPNNTPLQQTPLHFHLFYSNGLNSILPASPLAISISMISSSSSSTPNLGLRNKFWFCFVFLFNKKYFTLKEVLLNSRGIYFGVHV